MYITFMVGSFKNRFECLIRATAVGSFVWNCLRFLVSSCLLLLDLKIRESRFM
ncbi:hypothetical protein MUK42_37606 [Musa troglodytarum]|uniref:Uncharacterized protein n=1 Tax=Musa troglodytarum TaxID=320322 RepID=A0A9E7G6J1_9LILI|nr:hypothetical protein MUK42_37606 [Musa troglodytarum]